MRKFLMAGLIACALPLAGCATSGSGGGSTSIPTIDPATVAQVQQLATQVCGFVPTAVTVASVIATFTGGGAIVDMVGRAANGICSAVTAKGARRGKAAVYRGMNGRKVVIDGHFIGR